MKTKPAAVYSALPGCAADTGTAAISNATNPKIEFFIWVNSSSYTGQSRNSGGNRLKDGGECTNPFCQWLVKTAHQRSQTIRCQINGGARRNRTADLLNAIQEFSVRSIPRYCAELHKIGAIGCGYPREYHLLRANLVANWLLEAVRCHLAKPRSPSVQSMPCSRDRWFGTPRLRALVSGGSGVIASMFSRPV